MGRRWELVPCLQTSEGPSPPPPVGFVGDNQSRLLEDSKSKRKGDDLAKEKQLKERVAQEIAWAPAKSLPMQAIMMYMTGSSVSIISIMIVGMSLVNSVKALGAVHKRFERVDDGSVNLMLPKLIYVGVNLVFFGMGVWKCWKMGLLPTTSADWTSYIVRPTMAESSGVASSVFS